MITNDTNDFLQQAINQLPRQVQPTKDLWPGVEFAINEPAKRHWQHYSALAATVLLVLCTSLYFGRVAPEPSNSGISPSFIYALEKEHALSKQGMLVDYRGQQAVYDDWENDLQELETAEQVIYNALRENPDNLELLKILRQVHQKQLNLIDSVFAPRLQSI